MNDSNVEPPNQPTLPHVRGEDRDGQIELVDPGPRVELDAIGELAEIDPRQGVLPGCPGVRVGARWRRDSDDGKAVPWEQLQLRMDGLAKHRGRRWSEADERTMRQVQLQTWGIVEAGDRKLVVPEWMRGEIVDGPSGEIVLTRNPRARAMLAWVWAAFEAGTGGMLLTRDQWAELLCCSPRSVANYRRELAAKGLIAELATWAPAKPRGELVRGSWDGPVLLRIGPALEAVALAAFERKHVRYPRGQGIRRTHARAVAAALRSSARGRGWTLQHELRALRASWAQRQSERQDARRAASAAAASVRVPESPAVARGAKPEDVRADGELVTSGCWGEAPPAPRAAPSTDSLHGKTCQLPRPRPSGGGLGGAARGAGGASPQHPEVTSSPSARTSSGFAPRATAGDSGTRTDAAAALAAWRPPAERERPPNSTNAEAARRRARLEATRSRGSFADAAAELARALAELGNREAASAVASALAELDTNRKPRGAS